MTIAAAAAAEFACPRCDAPLEASGDAALACRACRVAYPIVAGVPWLFAEPQAALAEWRSRWQLAMQRAAHDAERLRAALAGDTLRPATRARLAHIERATGSHRERLAALLAPLTAAASHAPIETYLALRTRLPPD